MSLFKLRKSTKIWIKLISSNDSYQFVKFDELKKFMFTKKLEKL